MEKLGDNHLRNILLIVIPVLIIVVLILMFVNIDGTTGKITLAEQQLLIQSQTKTQTPEIIPASIKITATNLVGAKVCKTSFTPKLMLDSYKRALQLKNTELALASMTEWENGLLCLNSAQLMLLDIQFDNYIKTLSDKDLAYILNPAISLIELVPSDNKQSRTYSTLETKFKNDNTYLEVKKSFPHEVGVFLMDYNKLKFMRYTFLCKKKGGDVLDCAPIMNSLRNFFNRKNLGSGNCDAAETVQDEFRCEKGVICGFEDFAKNNPELSQILPAMVTTTFSSNSLSLTALDENSILKTKENVGNVANYICDKIKEELSGSNNEEDTRTTPLETQLGLDDDCNIFDSLSAEFINAQRDKKGNKIQNTQDCYTSDPEINNDGASIGPKKSSDKICKISDTSIRVTGVPDDAFTRDFTPGEMARFNAGERVCKNRFCLTLGADNVVKVEFVGSSQNPPESNTESTPVDLNTLGNDCKNSCIYDKNGNKLFDSETDGDSYYWGDESQNCVGKCGRTDDKNYNFLGVVDDEGTLEAVSCESGSDCFGPGDYVILEEPEPNDNPPEGETPPAPPEEDSEDSTACSPSAKRQKLKLECLTGLNGPSNIPNNEVTLTKKEKRIVIPGKLSNPTNNPDQPISDKCSTKIIGKHYINFNKVLCDKIIQYGRPAEGSPICNFGFLYTLEGLKTEAPKPIDPPK